MRKARSGRERRRQDKDGGPRACAWEPACDRSRREAKPCQTIAPGTRSTAAAKACGASSGAPVCNTLQAAQQPSWAWCPVWSSCPLPGFAPWQMLATASGSDKARLIAQQAPIGAKICTNRATRTIGRKFFSRRRIAKPIRRGTNHHRPWKSRHRSASVYSNGRNCPVVAVAPRTFASAVSPYPTARFRDRTCNWRWHHPNHFANCSKFEQSLPKMVTSPERWSTNSGSGQP